MKVGGHVIQCMHKSAVFIQKTLVSHYLWLFYFLSIGNEMKIDINTFSFAKVSYV